MTSDANGTGVTRLQEMAAELQEQLDAAKAERELFANALKEHDELIERLQVATRALAGPTPRGPYKKKANYNGALKDPDPQLVQLVEATIARSEEPVTVAALTEQIPRRSENTLRRIVYGLRDDGRLRIVRAGKGPHPATYAAMPEVVEEHAS